MRKSTSAKGVRTVNADADSKAVDQYLAGVPEPARTTLSKVRAIIQAVVPHETSESISYGVPTFKYKGGLVGFAAFAEHCSLFVMNPSVMHAFTDELKAFSTSKGTIRFPVDKPLPTALLKKLVKARIAQNEQKKQQSRRGGISIPSGRSRRNVG
jgi:uncharacterized protein YdhG (YjbR/CyaY superfamily)